MSSDSDFGAIAGIITAVKLATLKAHNDAASNREAADPAPKRQQGERERLRRLKRLEAQQ